MTSASVIYSLWAMSQAGNEEVALGFLLFLVGVPLYVLILRGLRRRGGTPSAGAEASRSG